MTVELLPKHNLEFLSLTGGCTGSSESTLVKMQHRWKSHVTAHNLSPGISQTEMAPFAFGSFVHIPFKCIIMDSEKHVYLNKM